MTLQEAADWLLARDGFLILTHVRPDGDTLGSAGALALALRQRGKRAYVCYNSGITGTYADYLTDCYAPDDFAPEHVVAVDIATENLLPREMECWRGKVELCIDHHPSNEFYAGETCLNAKAAACGEIIYHICTYMGAMDAAIAKLLYIAISTDCGCFVYNNTTPETHRIAAQLMEYGDFWQQVNSNCFETLSVREIRLQNRLLQGMQFYDDGAVAVGAISLADMEELGATQEDTEELASWAKKIEGVRVSATLRQLEAGVWKLSLRTGGTLNATRTCALLGGGGHAAAAGATLREVDETEARSRVLAAIRQVQAEEG
jgi:phosphoesterase RecJ-like protein